MAVLAGSNVTTGWTTPGSVQCSPGGVPGSRWNGQDYPIDQSGVVTGLWLYHPCDDNHDTNLKIALVHAGTGERLALTGVVPVPNTGTPAFIGASIAGGPSLTAGAHNVRCLAVSDGLGTGRLGIMNNGVNGNYTSESGTYASPPTTFSMGTDSGNQQALFFVEGPDSLSITVESADIAVQGQSIAPPITMPVTDAQAAVETTDIALLFDQAYVAPVTHAQMVVEGQELPFIITQPGSEAQIAVQGQELGLALSASQLITVDSSDVATQGQALTLFVAAPIISADVATQANWIDLLATGIAATGLRTWNSVWRPAWDMTHRTTL